MEGSNAVEWPHAIVDAPDAYFSYAKVRVDGLDVSVFDPRGNEVGVYVLDSFTVPAAGALAATVGGLPFTVKRDCDCGHGFSRIAKGN